MSYKIAESDGISGSIGTQAFSKDYKKQGVRKFCFAKFGALEQCALEK
jgi:hypothetical protein